MSKVKLEMTSKQYEKLIEAVFLGTWVVNSTEMELNDEFEEVRELVLSTFYRAGNRELVTYNNQADLYDLDINYESKLLDTYVEEYDEFSFWDKLIEKLAEKELVKQFGSIDGDMTEEMMERRLELEEEIGKRVEDTGITELEWVKKK